MNNVANVQVRVARQADVEPMNHIIRRSMEQLGAAAYSAGELAAVLAMVAVDTKLVDAGTYFVAEADGRIVGGGGWSAGGKLFGGDGYTPGGAEPGAASGPAGGAARIRAFFVDPASARQGIGTALLEACEEAARAAGFAEAELAATRPGEPFYRRHGYQDAGVVVGEVMGHRLDFVRMTKQLK